MQKAKVTKDSQQVENQPILDTDDLIFELGRQVITHLETKKKLERILKKQREASQIIEQALMDKRQAKERLEKLEESNKKYSIKIETLDKLLSTIRKEKTKLIDAFEKKIVEMQEELNVVYEENAILQQYLGERLEKK